MVPAVHAAEDNTIRLAIVGCGLLLAGCDDRNKYQPPPPAEVGVLGPLVVGALLDAFDLAAEIKAPVLGLYGAEDIGIPPNEVQAMKDLGVKNVLVITDPVVRTLPPMQVAKKKLVAARSALEKSTDEKGGHRAQALKLIDEAIAELDYRPNAIARGLPGHRRRGRRRRRRSIRGPGPRRGRAPCARGLRSSGRSSRSWGKLSE